MTFALTYQRSPVKISKRIFEAEVTFSRMKSRLIEN